MNMKRINRLAVLGLLCGVSGIASAVAITDPVGDFLSTYVASGRPTGADLDVVSADVIYRNDSYPSPPKRAPA